LSFVRSLALLIVLPFIPVAWGQQLPPVYFNHVPIFVDQTTLNDLMASSFLLEEFSAFQKKTTQRDGGKWSYTGVYVFGQGTYLEFLPAAAEGEARKQGTAPLGTVAFGMWIDERNQLSLIRDSLAKRTPGKPEIQVQRIFQDGKDLKWFDVTAADFPEDNSVRTSSFVMAMYGGEELKQRVPDLKPEEDGTTREKRYLRTYSAGKLLRGITRITLTVNQAEKDRLVQEFASFGYSIHDDANTKIAAGPEFELVTILVPNGAPRKLAISMKLNRSKDGPQILMIGNTSELRFDGDSAVWYFPRYW
jgi:hypothetical protein